MASKNLYANQQSEVFNREILLRINTFSKSSRFEKKREKKKVQTEIISRDETWWKRLKANKMKNKKNNGKFFAQNREAWIKTRVRKYNKEERKKKLDVTERLKRKLTGAQDGGMASSASPQHSVIGASSKRAAEGVLSVAHRQFPAYNVSKIQSGISGLS